MASWMVWWKEAWMLRRGSSRCHPLVLNNSVHSPGLAFLSTNRLEDCRHLLLPVLTKSNSDVIKEQEKRRGREYGPGPGRGLCDLILGVTSAAFAEFHPLEASHRVQPTLKGRGRHRGRNTRRPVTVFFHLLFCCSCD